MTDANDLTYHSFRMESVPLASPLLYYYIIGSAVGIAIGLQSLHQYSSMSNIKGTWDLLGGGRRQTILTTGIFSVGPSLNFSSLSMRPHKIETCMPSWLKLGSNIIWGRTELGTTGRKTLLG